MFEHSKDIITPSGLDTLSERALRRLTDRWTGSLHDADSLLDARSLEQATSADTFSDIVGQWRKAREIYHDGSVEEVFGEASSLAEGANVAVAEVEPLAASATDSLLNATDSLSVAATSVAEPFDEIASEEIFLSSMERGLGEWMPMLYDVLIIGALLYYIFCLYRYFDDIVALFHSVFQHQVVSTDRSGERRRSDIFYGALGKLFMMGLFFVGLLVALVTRRAESSLTMEQLFYMPFVAMAVFIVVICVQYVMLATMGFVTRSMNEVAQLMRIRLIYFVLAAVMVAPVLLVALMGSGGSYAVWQNVGFIAAIMAFGLFVRESVGFFISKKVSILHWILYLCTVEILPLTLLWQGVVRLA